MSNNYGFGNDAFFYDTFYTISGYQKSPSYIKHLIVGEDCSHPSRPVNITAQGVIKEWFCSDQCSCRDNKTLTVRLEDNEEAIRCFMNNLNNVENFVQSGVLPRNGNNDGMGTLQAQKDAECKLAVFNLYNDATDIRNEQANERIMSTHRLLYMAFCETPLRIFHFSKIVTHRHPVIIAYEDKKQAQRARAQLEAYLGTYNGREDYPHVICEPYRLPY